MADNNNKLSLHIGSKNGTTLSSGFVDVPAIPALSAKLSLNKQTVARLNNGGVGDGAGISFWTFTFLCMPDFTLGASPVVCPNPGSIYDKNCKLEA